MIRDVVAAMMVGSYAIFVFGLVWSGYTAIRMKNWNWLVALIFFGPFVYPFFAIIYRKTARLSFHAFWGSVALFFIAAALARTFNLGTDSSASAYFVGTLAIYGNSTAMLSCAHASRRNQSSATRSS